ncbi:FGGY family carbohydrate kinase [uncultured Microbacterium sp.]|uniref:FGGY family carbohydrate kinase n=1 Tax=uncultured Microbacterium sp. TaxID=191216 RepID=UPI0028D3DE06|nr:FGGY family carbohydrate kinase [uncultured Microbacterium sp.]
MSAVATSPAEVIASGRAVLGIELGSTRIKACLIGSDAEVLATGSYEWENVYAEKLWTYSLDAVWWGLQAAYAELVDNVRQQFGVTPERYAAIGVSAMMHGRLRIRTIVLAHLRRVTGAA